MKKRLIMFYIIISCFVIVGCDNKSESKISFNMDNEGNYIGFDKVRNYTSVKEAIADGCYIKDGDDFKGTENWKEFLDAALSGEDTQLRIVIPSDDTNEYIDLFYQDKLYYVFKSETDDLSVKGYQYLLVLEDSKTANNRIAYTVVLSNIDTLTFANITNDFISSKKIVTDESYKIVFWGMKSVD